MSESGQGNAAGCHPKKFLRLLQKREALEYLLAAYRIGVRRGLPVAMINIAIGIFLRRFRTIRVALDVTDVVGAHMRRVTRQGCVVMKSSTSIWIPYMKVRLVLFATKVPMLHLRRDT